MKTLEFLLLGCTRHDVDGLPDNRTDDGRRGEASRGHASKVAGDPGEIPARR